MPKLKSSRTAAKRFRFSKRGKVKHKHAYLRHLLTAKGRHRKRRLRRAGGLSKSDNKMVHRLLPYA